MIAPSPNSAVRDLRAEIARVDRAILVLVAARLRTAHQAIQMRVASGEEVTNGGQEVVVIDRARRWAEELGISPDFSARLFRALISAGKAWTEPPNGEVSDLPERVVGRLGQSTSPRARRPLAETIRAGTPLRDRNPPVEVAPPKA